MEDSFPHLTEQNLCLLPALELPAAVFADELHASPSPFQIINLACQ